MDAFVDYLLAIDSRDTFIWCLNPNSGDTGGLLKDDWVTPDNDKLTLMAKLNPNPTIVTFDTENNVCMFSFLLSFFLSCLFISKLQNTAPEEDPIIMEDRQQLLRALVVVVRQAQRLAVEEVSQRLKIPMEHPVRLPAMAKLEFWKYLFGCLA